MQRNSLLVLNSNNSIDPIKDEERNLLKKNFISNSKETIGPYKLFENLLFFGPSE